MRKIYFAISIILVILVSCENFAQKYNLSEKPVGDLAMELLDRSSVTTSNRVLIYTSFTTTQPRWANYIFSNVELVDPNIQRINMRINSSNIKRLPNDNYRISVSTSPNRILQGNYLLNIFVGDSNEVMETYSYPMNVSVDDTGPFLSPRLDDSQEPRAPFIMQEITGYDFAVSGTAGRVENIHVRPKNEFSSNQFTILSLIYKGNTIYLLGIEPDEMEWNEWISDSVEDRLIPVVNNPEQIPMSFQSNNDWEVVSYASTFIETSWGELIRSEICYVEKSDEDVSMENLPVIKRSRSVSSNKKSLENLRLSPLFLEMLENGGFGF